MSQIQERVLTAFPSDSQESIRENTLDIAKAIAQTAREDALQNAKHVEALVKVSLLLGPHITLDKKLRQAAEANDDPLSVITQHSAHGPHC